MLMKRSLFVAALATLAAGSALAQSNVTIWGRLNETVERQKVGGTSTTALVDSNSRLGFRGTEDLGGGLSANFLIEHRFSADGRRELDFLGRPIRSQPRQQDPGRDPPGPLHQRGLLRHRRLRVDAQPRHRFLG
jgi:hypothetical protein